MDRLVSVAVPIPLPELLTYRVPAAIDIPARGARVLVPLGSRVVTGCVVAIEPTEGDVPPRETVKDLLDVLDDEPFVPASVVDLAMWVADYYIAPPGESLAAAMPPRAWVQSERHVQPTPAGLEWLKVARAKAVPKTRADRREDWRADVLEAMPTGKPVSIGAISQRLRHAPAARDSRSPVHAVIRALERDGLVTVSSPLRGSRSAYRTMIVASLTAQGHDAVASLASGGGRGDANANANANANARAKTRRSASDSARRSNCSAVCRTARR